MYLITGRGVAKTAVAAAVAGGVYYVAKKKYEENTRKAIDSSESEDITCINDPKLAYRKFMPATDYPDLSKHNNCLANHLTPTLYKKLRNVVSIPYFSSESEHIRF